MSPIGFEACEVRTGGLVGTAAYAYDAHDDGTWTVRRDGVPILDLGPGYRPLRVSHAGICATDLARHHLPFPLPQVTGHEVVALEDDGTPVLVEINASHAARGLPREQWCGRCVAGLDTHCADRLVLGIDRLVGGFAPWLLAPEAALTPVPAGLDPLTAVLVEPFAAAWHAVETIDPADGVRVAVLGTGRLGLLLVAALDCWRRRSGRRIEVVAIARHPDRRRLARRLGADAALDETAVGGARDVADVVVESTGGAAGLAHAVRLARAEVHLKSTPGRPSFGLRHATELVVDEIAVGPWSPAGLPADAMTGAVLAEDPDGAIGAALRAAGIEILEADDLERLAARVVDTLPLGGLDVAVVDGAAGVDRVVRPRREVAQPLVHPRGRVLVTGVAAPAGSLVDGIVTKPLSLSTSRCGRFQNALPALTALEDALETPLGRLLVTTIRPARALADAQREAAAAPTLKVVMAHPGGLVGPGNLPA